MPVAERYTTTSREFLEAAQLAVASGWAIIQSARRLLGEVQARLRERYPDAVVRLRDGQTQLDELDVVVYAFRDGHAA